MAESSSASRRPTYPAGTVAKVSTDILNETFHNIIHDLVAKVHRQEKVARMRSAVVVARQKAEEEATVPDEAPSKSVPADGKSKEVMIDAAKLATTHLETEAATFDRGKVYLKGNPLQTVKEIICPDCRLPRLEYPPIGVGYRPPPDPNAEYCQNGPLITLPGHDVHGKMFAVMPNPKKKKSDKDSTIPEIPTSKCPICPRYFVMNRVAQHLDRCMNLGGRHSSTRNKTPVDGVGSNASSPTGSSSKRAHEDDDGSPSPTKKKKTTLSKKASKTKPGPSKLKNSFTVEDHDEDVKSENAE
ncbi:hypothetical protein N7539_004736 [Penicillium diatomitis]|uniref:SAGA-associated factor 11 n=1 Tax=Penicillium diatomitis TaxID=2819901 RepID=A0A9W9X5K9_9EURO|nr:uncharacterized protein N7539_004736 [Penicillium diatomitis]KAJ5484748.1 hypothetical protein N7539_004736 [Penicillium diatomitis]